MGIGDIVIAPVRLRNGSTRPARRAGIQLASKTTDISSTATVAIVAGSLGVTPNSSFSVVRVIANVATRPSTTPATPSMPASRSMRETRSREVAPSGHVISRKANVLDFWKRRIEFLDEYLDITRDDRGRLILQDGRAKGRARTAANERNDLACTLDAHVRLLLACPTVLCALPSGQVPRGRPTVRVKGSTRPPPFVHNLRSSPRLRTMGAERA